MNGTAIFLRSMFSRMSQTGAFSPSSRRLGAAVARAVPGKAPGRILRVLEVGAGTGAMTREIYDRLGPGDRLDLCEINPEFAEHLRRTYESRVAGPDVAVFECDATRLGGSVRYDVIASSLPLLNMEPGVVGGLFATLLARLAPDGTLAYWDYWGKEAWAAVGGPRSRARKQAVLEVTAKALRAHERSRRLVLANLPPAVVHYLKVKP